MEYTLTLQGSDYNKGRIALSDLALLSSVLNELAFATLSFRLKEATLSKSESQQLRKAGEILLTGISEGSTRLTLECNPLESVLDELPASLFVTEDQKRVLAATPLELVMEAIPIAQHPDAAVLDQATRNAIVKLEQILDRDTKLTFASPNRTEVVVVDYQYLAEVKQVARSLTEAESLPPPQQQVVSVMGQLVQLSATPSQFRLRTEEGAVKIRFDQSIDPSQLGGFFSRYVVVTVFAEFNTKGQFAGGLVNSIREASSNDRYFSRIPRQENLEQQMRQQSALKSANPIQSIAGKWNVDIEIDELQQTLREIRG